MSPSGQARRIALVDSVPTHAPAELEPGHVVPGTPYRIEAEIGQGGMGRVFRAVHSKIDRTVALKALSPHHCVDRRAVQTFRTEARASARIGATNIIDVFDFLEFPDGRLVICMEYVDGRALEELLDDVTFDLPRMIGVMRQVCRALSAAHGAGIVHRDVKPANILLAHLNGRPDFVKLLDFGIAAIQTEDSETFVAGTPEYIAPETVQKLEVDGRADQYALGVMLWEWACGRRPFEGEPRQVLAAQAYEPLPPFEPRPGRQVPERLRAGIERCLQKHPRDRFPSMDAVEAMLLEVQVEEGLMTAWDHLPLPDVGDRQRERLAVGMSDLTELSVPRRGRRLGPVFAVAAAVAALGAGAGWVVEQQRPRMVTAAAPAVADGVSRRALEAAREGRYVVPGEDADADPSALQLVLGLEALRLPETVEAAVDLRERVGLSLGRVGDHYRHCAPDTELGAAYYDYGRLFDAEVADPDGRGELGATQLDALVRQTQDLDFTTRQRMRADVLAAMARPDRAARHESLTALAETDRISPSESRMLDQVLMTCEGEAVPASPELDAVAESGAAVDIEDGERVEGRRRGRRKSAADRIARATRRKTAGKATPKATAVDDSGQPSSQETAPGDATAGGLAGPAPGTPNDAEADAADGTPASDGAAATTGDEPDFEQTATWLGEQLEQDPDNLELLDTLASLRTQHGQHTAAKLLLSRATRVEPNRASLWMRLGATEERLDHDDAAISAYEMAAALGEGDADRRIARLRRADERRKGDHPETPSASTDDPSGARADESADETRWMTD